MRRQRDVRYPDDLAAKIAPHVAAILALLVQQGPTPDELLPLADAARIAGTSVRVLRDAIRAKEVPAFGRQRDRVVRRADLDRWIESRRVVHEAIDDRDIERRMANLAKKAGVR
jgi:hypothetical protein